MEKIVAFPKKVVSELTPFNEKSSNYFKINKKIILYFFFVISLFAIGAEISRIIRDSFGEWKDMLMTSLILCSLIVSSITFYSNIYRDK